MRAVRIALGGLAVTLLVAVMAWPFVSGRWRGGLDELTATSPTGGTGVGADPSTTTTSPPPAITVAAAGRYGGEVLGALAMPFLERTGEAAEVRRLPSELDVWKLATESNRIGADVIEVGFRTDALSGEAFEAFLPLDDTLVPSLQAIPPEFRLAEDRGVIVGFSGLLGLVVSDTVAPPRGWADLSSLDPESLVVPSPRSVMAPVLVMAIADGDVAAGLDVYASWIDAGARTASTTDDYVEQLRNGAEVAVWTSSGLWRAEGRVQGVEFRAPDEGAVALPAFLGVLATSERLDLAAAWVELRLSPDIQTRMASIAEQGRFGQEDFPALSPVVSGLDELAPTSTAYFRLDTFPGRIVNIDWSAYAEARAQIDARLGDG